MLQLRQKMKLSIIIVACLAVASVAVAGAKSVERPASWAQPIKLDGVPNLHKVSDDLYRSAQPAAEGMSNLMQMGIETIVNLRSFHSDLKKIGDTGLAYERMYMEAWDPKEIEAVRFLQIVTNQKRTPVLVHCKHGADRTGALCALYRIAVQNWSKGEAIKEMTQGGFGFHRIWDNLIEWIIAIDIEGIKKRAGIEKDRKPVLTSYD